MLHRKGFEFHNIVGMYTLIMSETMFSCGGCGIAQFVIFRNFPHNLVFTAHFCIFKQFPHNFA